MYSAFAQGFIEQAWGQDGWILANFFFIVLLWTEAKSRSMKTQTKNEANTQPSWTNEIQEGIETTDFRILVGRTTTEPQKLVWEQGLSLLLI